VVVEAIENLDISAVGELPMGGVRLPELVGEFSREADERGARSLVRLRVIRPWRWRMRQMVATDGESPSSRRRW
jgi:hypothetical protein